MRFLLVAAAAALVAMLALPGVAGAEHSAEHRVQEVADLVERWAPPGTPSNTTSIWAWNYLTESDRVIGLYGLAAFCTNWGGITTSAMTVITTGTPAKRGV